MTRSRMVKVVTGAVAAIALAATVAFAQGPRGGFGPGHGGFGPGGPGGRAGMMGPGGLGLGQADLTDAQEQQVRDIRMRHQEAMAAVGERLRAAHEAQRKAVEAMPMDEGAIRAAVGAAAEVEADAAVQMARIRAEIWAVLTPEQQAAAAKRLATRDARMQERQGGRQERRQERRSR